MRLLRRTVMATLISVTALMSSATIALATDTITWADADDQSGVVVLVRHALAPGGGDPAGFRLGDCRTQRNLSAEGREQARRIGDLVRSSGSDVASVLTSPWCRTAETARLLGIGPVTTRPFLGSTFTAPRALADRRERQALRFLESRRDDQDVVIAVTHYANILDLTGIATQSGEALAVRIDEGGKLDVIGRIPAP